ncbi:tripartite tricarboxylate transporter permease [Bosea sp. NBC_00550]|uniref:tripartite tricarboxylate transporter permease n=1 Tax=Bosea sp. NBC_00550 TaxID=2969621 RepID=UPI0022309D77|nr:tripartite tricarboxylate transporter permease [Bosea sp. NBC_00550]UZF92104.1 tripartite tricarboxylate transporter permease [Bosea sp. NBC_00550]
MHLVVSSYGESFALIGSVSLGADVETSPSVPRRMLMPIILLFAIVGSYAINNSLFDVGLMLAFGVLAFVLEENDFPVAPVILGVVLGPLLEEYFINSMIKSDGRLIGLVDRPIAAVLAAITIAIVGWTIVASLRSAKANEQHTAG